ncbi:MAG: (2Fe-2S) ferredoxin domain-containing protein [Alphaproteobacteria bacterium]
MAVVVSICMGSSCFARGNLDNLELIEEFIKKNDLSSKVELVGCRCENACSKGPNIRINGKIYHNADIGSIIDIIKQAVKEEENEQ